MHSFDQLECASLGSAELIARALVQAEVAVKRNARFPDYSGLDILIAAPVGATGQATTNRFNAWASEKLNERSQIWRQDRLYREERRQQQHGHGRGGGGDDPDGDGRGGGKVSSKKGRRNRGAGGGDAAGEAS